MRPKYDFQWLEKEDRRRGYRASVGRDGKLRLGKNLRGVLPEFIQVGFDAEQKVLALADGRGTGICLPKCGVLGAQALSSRIAAAGLRLPVSFRLVQDDATGFFLGRILPRRRAKSGRAWEYDPEQVRVLYQYIIDFSVRQLAKSTPLEERRACAMEAFYTAVREYCPGCGELDAYLEVSIQDRLTSENRQYSQSYALRSLDQPLAQESDSSFCLYDTAAVSTAGGIDQIEDRIMAEQFLDTLTAAERSLLQMLQAGRPLPDISRTLGLSEKQLTAMGREIARKRRRFYEAV